MRQKLPEGDRFWRLAQRGGPDDCWPWLGHVTPNGYGKFKDASGRLVLAHRKAWLLERGDIPDGDGYHGVCVLHKCDNRRCVNPAHFFLGNHLANVQDMMRKGRGNKPYGERVGSAKLTLTDVEEIRSLLRSGRLSQREIGDLFGVQQPNICKINRGNGWAKALQEREACRS